MPNDPNDTVSVFYPKRSDAMLAETPDLSKAHCYVCEPAPDPKLILRPFPCSIHQDRPIGSEDGATSVSDGTPSGSGPADGNESNRAACDIVHRKQS